MGFRYLNYIPYGTDDPLRINRNRYVHVFEPGWEERSSTRNLAQIRFGNDGLVIIQNGKQVFRAGDGRGARLAIEPDGNFMMLDRSGNKIWETGPPTGCQAGGRRIRYWLLDSGRFFIGAGDDILLASDVGSDRWFTA